MRASGLTPWTVLCGGNQMAGVKETTRFATVAPQHQQRVQTCQRENEPQSEDCRYLNIWTPNLDNAERPVLFWIHGGGFTQGSGSQVGSKVRATRNPR